MVRISDIAGRKRDARGVKTQHSDTLRTRKKDGRAGRSGYGNHAARSVRSLLVAANFSVSLGITASGSKALDDP